MLFLCLVFEIFFFADETLISYCAAAIFKHDG